MGRLQDDAKRLCLVDDLKKFKDHIHPNPSIRVRRLFYTTIDENSTLWLRRLGHANMRPIQSLASKKLVRNLPKIKFDKHLCDVCKIGKQAHTSHKAKNIVSMTRCLELLHMDLFGPSFIRSYEGNHYTLVIVDDYSRKIKESLNVTFDETPPPSKTSTLVDDDLDEEEAIKPKNLNEALTDESWIVAMQEELNQFITNDVWELAPQPRNITIIGTKWAFRNKFDENGIISQNKATLVVQGYNQQEGIDYDETYALVARLEYIRILLAYACALDFKIFQMDVKSAFLNGFINEEPKNLNEALTDESWIVAMQEELNQFITNDVWELAPQPRNITIIGTKWAFRNKFDENGIISQNKATLVVQGYNQQEGIDYDETYALVARLEYIRILLAYACALDFKIFQMDVKSAFLNGFINEEVYVTQPPGFIDFEKPDHVYKLKKALYGLKQASKAWYDRLKSFLIKHEYKIRMVDNTLFTKKKSSNLIIVQIYVNDIIFGSTCQEICDEFTKIMHDEFKMSMMGELNFFLGLQIKQMEDGLWYPKGTDIETIVYADSDHAGDYVDRKSTSSICTFVGCCLTSWFSKKQTALAISTTEAEYVSAGKACQQALWMKKALIDYDIRFDDVPIMRDNKSAIDLSKNPTQHSRTKHIEIRHHFLRNNVQKGHISIEKVSFVDNIVDILTKLLKRESFNYLRLGLGMMEHIP
nr:retrotransposon protein, putative, unclassified [Tanacetum cinerariifolium]